MRELLEDSVMIIITQEFVAYNWITTLLVRRRSFILNQKEFTDFVTLTYGRPVAWITSVTTNNAMTYKVGGSVCFSLQKASKSTDALQRSGR